MDKQKKKTLRRIRRRARTRRRVIGTPTKPRLAVFRSLRHIYVQVIDDMNGTTICSASTRDASMSGSTGTVDGSAAVGKALAERAKEKGISEVIFDRGGFRYHGRVKALAEAAREAGLKF